MAADLEIEALASHADRLAAEAAQQRGRILMVLRRAVKKSETIKAYRRLFLDQAGNLKPDAATVIADFGAVAQLGRFDPGIVSDSELRERNGARRLGLHILSRLDLDGSQLRQLAKTLRETNGE